MEKVVTIAPDKIDSVINIYFSYGWRTKFCVAPSISSSDSSKPGTFEARGHSVVRGDVVFVLEIGEKEYNVWLDIFKKHENAGTKGWLERNGIHL